MNGSLRRRAFLVRFVLLSLPVPWAASGCAQQQSAPPASLPAPGDHARSASAAIAVQNSPVYQEAARRYACRDYGGALARIDQLLAVPPQPLNAAERAFLQRQKALCQSALTGKPVAANANAANKPVAVAPPSSPDCGPRALVLACRQMKVAAPPLAQLCRAAGTTKRGTTLAGLAKAAKTMGLKATGVQMDKNALARLSGPAVAWANGNHFVAVLAVQGDTAIVHDPNKNEKEEIALSDLLGRSGGILLTLSR